MRSKLMAAVAAASLFTASSVAAAQAVAPAAAANVERSGADLDASNELRRGGGTVLIIGAVVLALLIWGIIELTEDDEDAPVSP